MADFRRIILYFALALVSFLLWKAWQEDHNKAEGVKVEQKNQDSMGVPPPPKTGTPKMGAPKADTDNSIVPAHIVTEASNTSGTSPQSPSTAQQIPQERLIHVKTDVIDVLIDKKGGNIVKLALLKYPIALKTTVPVTLFSGLTREGNKNYSISGSGIISTLGPDTQTEPGLYEAEKQAYALLPNEKTLSVILRWKNAAGLQVQKVMTFERNKYSIKVNYQVENKTNQNWTGNFYAQIKQKESESEDSSFALNTFTGAALSTQKKHYEKLTFKKMNKENLDESTQGGWLAFQKRYFLTAWIPDAKQINRYYTRSDQANKIYTIGTVGPLLSLKPNEKIEVGSTLYAGPEEAKELKVLAPYLDLTVDYGWLWFIAGPIFWIMNQIHTLVGNWGLSIILVTVLIKLAFFHLSATSYRSMAKMQKLTPALKRIREQYESDRQRLSIETMALYRREKVNPLSGCLPMIVQIPFFFALYYVLLESVELRQAPFVLWIHDLSAKDPYYILPILMGLSMLIQQRLNPPPADPVQAKVMMFMPIMFTFFFLNFPSGLVLYWITNNCLSILQQWWIMRSVAKTAPTKK